MRRWMLAVAVVVYAVAPASAQNVAANNGIWWGGPGGPSAFTVLNPLTTLYGRFGFSHAWQPHVGYSLTGDPRPYDLNMPDGFGVVAGIGTRLMPAIRYELEFSGTFNGTGIIRLVPPTPSQANTRVGSVQVMNNLFLDVAPLVGGLGRFNAYVMGGVGVSWNRTSDLELGIAPALNAAAGTGATRVAFAWNLGAGGQYQIVNNLILDVGYRYLSIGGFRNDVTLTTPSGRSGRVGAHQLMISLVVPFDGLIRGFGN